MGAPRTRDGMWKEGQGRRAATLLVIAAPARNHQSLFTPGGCTALDAEKANRAQELPQVSLHLVTGTSKWLSGTVHDGRLCVFSLAVGPTPGKPSLAAFGAERGSCKYISREGTMRRKQATDRRVPLFAMHASRCFPCHSNRMQQHTRAIHAPTAKQSSQLRHVLAACLSCPPSIELIDGSAPRTSSFPLYHNCLCYVVG